MADEPQSIREMAEGQEPETELFPMGSVEGDDLTAKTIIKANQELALTASLLKGEVPVSGKGLFDPAKEAILLVYAEPGPHHNVPTKEGDRGDKRVTGWKVRQDLRPVYIERLNGEEDVIEKAYKSLLDADPSRAGALLDRLKEAAAAAMSAA